MRWLGLSLIMLSLVALDEQVVANPKSVTFTDHLAERHWQALFDPLPRHPQRHLIALGQLDPRYPSLLAARLLYRGDPWTRRGDDSGLTASEWRRRCQPLLVAALRELRLRDDAGLEHVDIAILARESDSELAIAALIDLVRRNADFGKAGALRIAVPEHAEALPASRNEEARRLARAFLVETWGSTDPDARRAIERGLASTSRGERNAAITLIPRGSGDDLLAAILPSLLDLGQAAQAQALDFDGIALACEGLSAIDAALLARFGEAMVKGRREVVGPLCDTLIRLHSARSGLPIAAIAKAARNDSDTTRRHHRLRLLLRLAPDAIADATKDDQDPWRRLAEHRAALARWK